MNQFITDFIIGFWGVFASMAPWLLFGFFIAGILSVFVSPEWVERNMGKRNASSVIKTSLLGVPLPLCSCGVIPVSASLRKHGASRGATVAFLISTPQTGVDSIFATYSVMGWVFAIFRPMVAFIGGVLGGLMVNFFEPQEDKIQEEIKKQKECADSCCSIPKEKQGFWNKIKALLKYGFVTLPSDIAGPMVVGLLLAGLITALVPQDFIPPYMSQGLAPILLMILVATPMYVCATAAVPIAAAFMMKGISPGAALAFMTAGPATNAATIAIVWRVLGTRSVITYVSTVILTAVFSGLLLDQVFTFTPMPDHHMHHESANSLFNNFFAITLVLMFVNAYFQSRKKSVATIGAKGEIGEMEQSAFVQDNGTSSEKIQENTVYIQGMTCSHCAATVEKNIREIPGILSAQVLLHEKKAFYIGQVPKDQVIESINQLGYKATGEE